MVELLAPSGNFESFMAAINSGADAVYMGMQSFGARANAQNFDYDTLINARRISAFYGKKIYITLNTLIKQNELTDVIAMLKKLGEISPDAIIVQDIGIASLIKKILPNMDIHASTQMAIHSLSGAKFLKENGFSRVVLARECSIDTIKEVCDSGIEVEVFVHGALCVSMSGQCLMSSFHGGRSGNRGRCAQVCRKPISFKNNTATWLSTRDMMLYDSIPELISAGVKSFKIEGRLKSPSYVANVCSQYRKGIDKYYQNSFKIISKDEYINLMQTFNRGDFSKGYLAGAQDFNVINSNSSNNQGVYLGTVERIHNTLVDIRLAKEIHNKDMLRISDDNTEYELIYSGKNVASGSIVSTYIRNNESIKRGMKVYRLISQKQVDDIECNKIKPIDVSVEIKLKANEKACMRVYNDKVSSMIYGAVCEEAKTKALSDKQILDNIHKIDKYNINIKNIEINNEGVFLRISELNELRRNAYEAFYNMQIKSNIKKHSINDIKILPKKYESQNIDIVSSSLYEIQNYVEGIFVFAPNDNRKSSLNNSLSHLNKDSFVKLNTSLNDDTIAYIISLVRKYDIRGVILDNIGQLGHDFSGMEIAIGDHVPIMNSLALEFINKYKPSFIIAFPEITKKEMEEMNAYLVYKYYGRERMMILNHCPARTYLSLSSGKSRCDMCHTNNENALIGKKFLANRKEEFPLIPIFTDDLCIVEMYNDKITNLSSYSTDFKNKAKYISFVDEDLDTQIRILNDIKKMRLDSYGTLGHYIYEIK